MKLFQWIILATFTFANLHCASTGDSGSSSSSSEKNSDGDKNNKDQDESFDGKVSSQSNIFTYSLSNSPLTSKQFSVKTAKGLANDLEKNLKNPSVKDLREMVALMSLYRMSGGNLDSAFNIAKKIALNEMKVDISRKLPESVILELALTAIQVENYSMADHWLIELSDSKDKKILAAIDTARGIIEERSGRLPEAIFYWNEALEKFSSYEPARLNIGFYALKYGDIATAKKMLSTLDADYFILTGLMQAERLSDRGKKVESMCERVIKLNPKYKPALFSCALNTFQGLEKLEEAKKELEKVAQVEGPPVEIDEKAFLAIGKVESAQKSVKPNPPKK